MSSSATDEICDSLNQRPRPTSADKTLVSEIPKDINYDLTAANKSGIFGFSKLV